ncbi:MAG: 3-hydroxybutyryl-CoA dehydrogenase [Odoribacter sp.]
MKIGVIGTGTMGNGIAQVFAQAGYDVLLKGRSEASLAKAHKAIDKNLSRMVEKGKLEAERKIEILSKIKDTLQYEDCRDADLLIEAIAEDMATKHEVFRTLDAICKPEAILATNTSSLSITEVAAATGRPERVIGMHFFNPVPAMKLVEVIKGQLTSQEVHDQVFALSQEIGKTPVSVDEAPGFVVNRILIPLVNEGIGILADGVAKKEEIDTAMKLGANHPMGPLELGDLIGLDVCLAIMEVLYNEFGDSKYRPHPLLRKMVRANLLGRKTGIGFYDYRK